MSWFLLFFFHGVILLCKEHTCFIWGYLIPLSFQIWYGHWRMWCRENVEFMKLSDERFSVYCLNWILISNTSKSGRAAIFRMIPLNKSRRVEKHCSLITTFSCESDFLHQYHQPPWDIEYGVKYQYLYKRHLIIKI